MRTLSNQLLLVWTSLYGVPHCGTSLGIALTPGCSVVGFNRYESVYASVNYLTEPPLHYVVRFEPSSIIALCFQRNRLYHYPEYGIRTSTYYSNYKVAIPPTAVGEVVTGTNGILYLIDGSKYSSINSYSIRVDFVLTRIL